MARKLKKQTVLSGMFVLAGLALMAYPFVSNRLYEQRQEEVIYQYQDQVEQTSSELMQKAWEDAVRYNEELRFSGATISDPFDPDAEVTKLLNYDDQLNLSGDGLMAYVEVPAISVFLPVYHGTSSHVLDRGVGHLENSSLPVGGESTHAVLSAHSGLTDKKLFTDLELLEEGDCFYIHVLDEILAYEVDQITVVDPGDTENLTIIPGEDHVTLVTCTPYGINSHRLLVRGVRIPYVEEEKQAQRTVEEESVWMRQYRNAMAASVCLLAAIFAVLIVRERKRAEK